MARLGFVRRMSSTGAERSRRQAGAEASTGALGSCPRGAAQACLDIRRAKPYAPREKHDEFSGRARSASELRKLFLTSGKDLGGEGPRIISGGGENAP